MRIVIIIGLVLLCLAVICLLLFGLIVGIIALCGLLFKSKKSENAVLGEENDDIVN